MALRHRRDQRPAAELDPGEALAADVVDGALVPGLPGGAA
jgi:hypothetical protein